LATIAGNIAAGHAGKRRNGGEKPGYARHPAGYARYFALQERFGRRGPVLARKARQK
jgi:hypothetical protein